MAVVRSLLIICSFVMLVGAARADKPVDASTQGPAAASDSASPLMLISPQDNAEISNQEVTVRLAVRIPPGKTLLSLRVLIDGRIAAQARGLVPLAAATVTQDPRVTHMLTVQIPPRDCVLSIFAETLPTSTPRISARLRWRGSASAPGAPGSVEQAALIQPRMFVLAIGVSEYQQPELRLRLAAKDARDLTAQLAAQNRLLYRSVETKLLVDRQASKAAVLDGLEWLQRQTTAKDLAVLFLAGHGITDPSTGRYYFLPQDAELSAIKRTMVSESEIRDTLAAIPGKVILFLDSCHSGKVYNNVDTRSISDLTAFITDLARAESGVVVFAASTGQQASQESATWGNGAFTKALIEGLKGRADYQKTGRITLNMLDLYVSERVKQLTGGRQTPTTAKPSTIPDFPIAIVREVSNDDVELVR